MLNNQPKMPLKLFLKSSLKTAEGTGDLIGNPPKKTLQFQVKQRYLEKDIYLQKKTGNYL